MNTVWRLPAPVRSLLASNFQSRSLSSAAGERRLADPLRILFCGSDEFSIVSLRALHDAQHSIPDLIEDIRVAHRPAKPTGRGLKTLREGNYASSHLSFYSCNVLAGWLAL
jgi:methionyl-tRNA formyltransferase